MSQIYADFGLNFTEEFHERLGRYIAEHPQHAEGVHRYSPEQFGLSNEEIRRHTERHTAWLEEFGR